MNSQRIVLHIDMNSYFASVEQQANPLLRGKPVGVCAYLSPNGCILASSIEAKKFGVKTGMRAKDGQRLCPSIVLLENDPAKYRTVTQRIFSILAEYTDRLEPYSIDEAFLDLTGWCLDYEAASVTALTIKNRITAEVGDWLKCSIGIAPTRYLAKLGSDVAPKNSVFMITEQNLETVLRGLKITEAWGIKQRLELRLNRLGIFTLLDLKNYPLANLMQAMGRGGYYLWANVNGVETDGVKTETQTQPKSFGHQYALAKKTTDPIFLKGVLMKLCEKTGRRLRGHSLQARTLSAYLAYVSGGGIFHTRRTAEPLFTTASIYGAAERLLLAQPLRDRARLIHVSVTGLVPLSYQASLFDDSIKQKKAAVAMDTINETFGEFTVISGEMFGMQKFVQDRIGFRKIEL